MFPDSISEPISLTFEYEVPRPAASIPVLGNKVVSHAIGGWAISGYTNLQSAANILRPTNGAANPITRWLGRGTGGAQLKKNPDGSYMSPWSVDWTDYAGTHHTDPIDINCRCFDPEKTIVLNPNAWENAPDGVFPAQNSALTFFRQPRRLSESANLARNFRFGKERKYALQIPHGIQNPSPGRYNRSIGCGIIHKSGV